MQGVTGMMYCCHSWHQERLMALDESNKFQKQAPLVSGEPRDSPMGYHCQLELREEHLDR